MINIGILKEEKHKTDKRVPFTPKQSKYIENEFGLKIYCQSSKIRCFSNDEYTKENIEVRNNLSNCDIFFGIKEVDEDKLVEGKKYLFFSHTIKKQGYNRIMLKKIIEKKISLIDYECIKDDKQKRIVAFGKIAGIVGAYNAILGYGKKLGIYKLKRCFQYNNYNELKNECNKMKLPKIKILVLGNGKVAKGVIEILKIMKIKEVKKDSFKKSKFENPVYCQIESKDYYKSKNRSEFSKKIFYKNPEKYKSDFKEFMRTTDILINATYWRKGIPKLFTINDMNSKNFSIKLIADISCDIEGLIPCTKKSSTIQNPFYDYDSEKNQIKKPFENKKFVSVMAIDNLPSELPKDASKDFGDQLINHVLKPLTMKKNIHSKIIQNATITEKGKLTKNFLYLKDYVS